MGSEGAARKQQPSRREVHGQTNALGGGVLRQQQQQRGAPVLCAGPLPGERAKRGRRGVEGEGLRYIGPALCVVHVEVLAERNVRVEHDDDGDGDGGEAWVEEEHRPER